MAQTGTYLQISNARAQKSRNDDGVDRTKAWISTKLYLQEFNIREQFFVIAGWINVFWKIDPKEKEHKKIFNSKEIFDYFQTNNAMKQFSEETKEKESTNDNEKTKQKEMINDNIEIVPLKLNDKNAPKFLKVLNLQTVKWNNKLPINCTKLFDETSQVDVEYYENEPPRLEYNMDTGAAHLQIHIKTATLYEKLELFSFPFDFQFLNLKIRWNYNRFEPMEIDAKSDEDPEHRQCGKKFYNILKKECLRGDYMADIWKNMVEVTSAELLMSEIKMENPLVHIINDANSNLKIVAIRLKIHRKESYYVWSLLFPLFMTVSCVFATFFMADNDNKLTYAISVLLTFVATQFIVKGELPHISAMTFCDYYILSGYIVSGMVIIWCVVHYDDGIEVVHIQDPYFLFTVILWGGMNVLYGLLWIKDKFCGSSQTSKLRCCKCCNNEKKKCCRCCFSYLAELTDDWKTRSKAEIEDWKSWGENKVKYVSEDGCEKL